MENINLHTNQDLLENYEALPENIRKILDPIIGFYKSEENGMYYICLDYIDNQEYFTVPMLANGSPESYDGMRTYLEESEVPENVLEMISENNYLACSWKVEELERVGYTADYGLEGELIDLRIFDSPEIRKAISDIVAVEKHPNWCPLITARAEQAKQFLNGLHKETSKTAGKEIIKQIKETY